MPLHGRPMSNAKETDNAPGSLPSQIQTTIAAITDMHTRHQRRATPSQRAFQVMAGLVSRPRFLGFLTFAVAAWIAGNLTALRFGLHAWDPPPFSWLQGAVSICALYTTAIILIAQKREDELGALREQLILELAILSEQKSAKTIELLERLRHDLPSVPNSVDAEASAMAQSADPMSVADALIESHSAAALDLQGETAGEAGR